MIDRLRTAATNPASGLDVMILCGGLGTRLREETEFKPKPMVEIGGKPILWHIMKHYHAYGVRNFIICLGYKGDAIRDYFINYRRRNSDIAVDFGKGAIEELSNGIDEDWRVILAETGHDSLTGTRIRRALKYVRGNRFMATYGDGVCNVDLPALVSHHENAGRLATVTAVHPSSRYGELAIQDGVVRTFREKPQVNDGWINGGFFVFERDAFNGVNEAENPSLEQGVLENLAQDNQLAVYQHPGFWQCMDTFREMQMLNDMWEKGHAPWKTWDDTPRNFLHSKVPA
jgi:glucose-1-phosphate cytidylyltransferase